MSESDVEAIRKRKIEADAKAAKEVKEAAEAKAKAEKEQAEADAAKAEADATAKTLAEAEAKAPAPVASPVDTKLSAGEAIVAFVEAMRVQDKTYKLGQKRKTSNVDALVKHFCFENGIPVPKIAQVKKKANISRRSWRNN